MKIILQALQHVFRRIFRGNKPSPKVKPERIQANKKSQPKPEQNQVKQQEDNRPFWQDKLKADTTDKKRAFYEKYRDRLENQRHDISPKQ